MRLDGKVAVITGGGSGMCKIASELFVSVNTVKTHLKAIYRKLDVADRREAVRRARRLEMLAP